MILTPSQGMIGWHVGVRRALIWLTVILLVSAAYLGSGTRVARAESVPDMPPIDASYYMLTGSTDEAQNMGCAQASVDLKADGAISEVVLDFGGQDSSTGGALGINGHAFSRTEIEDVAEGFATGYVDCTNNATVDVGLFLAIGTNDSLDSVDAAGGESWADLINDIVSRVTADGYASKVLIEGASDMEPGFTGAGGPSGTVAWAQAFADNVGQYEPGIAASGDYVNNGSADGCSLDSHDNEACNSGWTQQSVYELSWGIDGAYVLPEIYHHAESEEWEQIALYGVSSGAEGVIEYDGPLDEYPKDQSTLTAQQAWDDFETELNSESSTAQTMLYSAEQNNEPSA